MRLSNLIARFTISVLILVILTGFALPQKPGSQTPRQEKLLNGLKVLMWNDPAAPDVRVSVRIHAGSSFDPQGKEGVMRLLANSIFPSTASREFFKEDLDGTLEVISNYDYIQINATAKPSEFITLLETVSQAVSNPTIDKEITATLKKVQLEELTVLGRDPAYVADQAAAKRLFGTFPYGRPQVGTLESLERIDFADLLFVKERFLSADNSTVAISGNFNSDLGFRAARRYLGAWLKSDKKVPSTFRQPDDPDTTPLILPIEGAPPRATYAFRGLARNDPDYIASLLLEKIANSRLQKKFPGSVVSHRTHVLPGYVLVGVTGSVLYPSDSFDTRISEAEFSQARSEVAAALSKRSLSEEWLDADTYRTEVGRAERSIQSVTVADVQRVATRFRNNPVTSVYVGRPTVSQ